MENRSIFAGFFSFAGEAKMETTFKALYDPLNLTFSAQAIDGFHTLCVLKSAAFGASKLTLSLPDRRFNLRLKSGTFLACSEVGLSGLSVYPRDDFLRCVHHTSRLGGVVAFIVAGVAKAQELEFDVFEDHIAKACYTAHRDSQLAPESVLSAFRKITSCWFDAHTVDFDQGVLTTMHDRSFGVLLRILWSTRWSAINERYADPSAQTDLSTGWPSNSNTQ